jgi:hypothetical protein
VIGGDRNLVFLPVTGRSRVAGRNIFGNIALHAVRLILVTRLSHARSRSWRGRRKCSGYSRTRREKVAPAIKDVISVGIVVVTMASEDRFLTLALDEFPYLSCKHVHCEGLCNHLHPLVQMPIPDHGILRIAGDEQHL